MPPEDISKLGGIRPIGSDEPEAKSPNGSFSNFMRQVEERASPSMKGVSSTPFDLAHSQTPIATGPTLGALLSQAKLAHSMLGDMSDQLVNNKNLKLRPSQARLLRSKLSSVNQRFEDIQSKLGTDRGSKSEVPKGGTVMEKFLGLVDNSQSNLALVQEHLSNLKNREDALNPVDFLFIQTKLAHAQQELEFASILLSKGVEDIKNLMNIQI